MIWKLCWDGKTGNLAVGVGSVALHTYLSQTTTYWTEPAQHVSPVKWNLHSYSNGFRLIFPSSPPWLWPGGAGVMVGGGWTGSWWQLAEIISSSLCVGGPASSLSPVSTLLSELQSDLAGLYSNYVTTSHYRLHLTLHLNNLPITCVSSDIWYMILINRHGINTA